MRAYGLLLALHHFIGDAAIGIHSAMKRRRGDVDSTPVSSLLARRR